MSAWFSRYSWTSSGPRQVLQSDQVMKWSSFLPPWVVCVLPGSLPSSEGPPALIGCETGDKPTRHVCSHQLPDWKLALMQPDFRYYFVTWWNCLLSRVKKTTTMWLFADILWQKSPLVSWENWKRLICRSWTSGSGTSALQDRKANEKMGEIKGASCLTDRRCLLWPICASFWIPDYFGKLESFPTRPLETVIW